MEWGLKYMTKIHYKMYKDGKKWVVMGLSVAALGAAMLALTGLFAGLKKTRKK